METGDQQRFQQAMSQGHSAAWDQMWQQAADYYRKALAEIPDHPLALTSLGLALFELKNYQEALYCYQKAAQITPDDPIPVEKIARIYELQEKTAEAVRFYLQSAELNLKARDVEKAIQNWVKVVHLQPTDIVARSRLAIVFERIGRKMDAISEYLSIASLMQQAGDVQKALQAVERALQIMPEHVEAQQTLTMLRSNQKLPPPGKPRPPSGQLRPLEPQPITKPGTPQKEELDPLAEGRHRAMEELAAFLFEEGETEGRNGQAARRGLSDLTRGTGSLIPRPQVDRARLMVYISEAIEAQIHGKDEEAASNLERAIENGLGLSAAYYNLGLLQANTSYSSAIRNLQRSVKNPKYALPSYLLLGRVYEVQGDYSKAATSYLQALCLADVETAPQAQAEDIRVLYEPIIEQYTQQSDTNFLKKLCQSIFQHLNRVDWRRYLDTVRQQALSETENGQPIPLFELLMETSGSEVVESMGRIRELVRQKKYRSAMEEAYSALQSAPSYLPLHVQMGEILLQQGRNQDAVNKFLLVAELYNLRGETAQAIRLLNRAVKLMPMDIGLRTHLIELLKASSQIDEAVEQYVELANVHYQLAELDAARQTYMAALHLAQKAPTDRSWNVQILYKIADIDMQRLNWRQAIRVFEQIRTLEPEDFKARSSLVELNFRLGQDAAALAEVDGFVALLENSGKAAKAVDFLKRLIAEQPDCVDLRKRLADLYIRHRRVNEAVEQLDWIANRLLDAKNVRGAMNVLQTIIELNPPEVASYREALQKLKNQPARDI